MAVRRTLSALVARTVEVPVREWIRAEGEANRPDVDVAAKIEALEAANTKLEKRLSMAMGALQAATAQLMQVKTETAAAANQAKQAMQRATSAAATAEAAADGVTGVEEAMAALVERLGTAEPAPAKKAAPSAAPTHCKVDGCSNKHRARGYCAKHYQQWKRGTITEG